MKTTIIIGNWWIRTSDTVLFNKAGNATVHGEVYNAEGVPFAGPHEITFNIKDISMTLVG